MIAPDILGTGEYGATCVAVTRDGSTVRVAVGRNGADGPVYHGAFLLSPEALKQLKEQIASLGDY